MAEKQNTEDGQSYQKYTIQLLREIASRAGNLPNKDEQLLNVLPEVIKDKNANDQRTFLLKRAGTAELIASQTSFEIRGMIFWEDYNKLLYAAGGDIYVYDFNTSTVTPLIGVFGDVSGEVGFTEYLYDSGGVVIVASNGTDLLTIDASNVVTTCTDPDLPVPHKPSPVFLDGYIFLAKSGSADIYNSDLNDPMAWTSGNFISAEMGADLLIRLSKINNYLIAFGSETIEYFWDEGNATGSPLSRNDSPIKLNTYIGGFAQFGNDIMYIGKNSAGQPSVYLLKDFKIDEVSTPTVCRYLNNTTGDSADWKGGVLAIQGHTVYLLSAGDYTYSYDIENKLWGTWAYKATNRFPIVYAARATNATEKFSVFAFKGADSAIYAIKDTYTQDSSTNFTCRIITEQSNFGTLNRKTMSRIALYADRTPANSNLSVYWTDDDFQTWNGPRTINMNQDLQSTYVLGSFRQRAFKLEYTGPYILRLQTIEADINKGIS